MALVIPIALALAGLVSPGRLRRARGYVLATAFIIATWQTELSSAVEGSLRAVLIYLAYEVSCLLTRKTAKPS